MEQPRFGHNDSSKVSAKGGFPGLLFGRHQATVNSNVQAVVCGPCGGIRTSNRLPEADCQSPSQVSVLLLCFYNTSRCHANTPKLCRCAVWLDQVICTWDLTDGFFASTVQSHTEYQYTICNRKPEKHRSINWHTIPSLPSQFQRLWPTAQLSRSRLDFLVKH